MRDEEYTGKQKVLDSIDQFIEDRRQRRIANEGILSVDPPGNDDGADESDAD